MRISYNPLWQNWKEERSGRDFVQDEMEMLLKTEDLGFDIILCPEHHFDQHYSACPDNFLCLTYVAARTERIQLGLGAVIVPWNTPLRVVEKFSMLDHMSDGRCQIGFGRGLAKYEYDRFGLDMDESRARFNEGYRMIMEGLKTGVIEGDGPHYRQPRTEIVPVPRPELADLVVNVGMSPESAENAGEFGGELLMFMTKDIESSMPLIQGYYDKYTEATGNSIAPAPTTTDFVFCDEDPKVAAEGGALYAGNYFSSVVRHYSLDGDHFAGSKDYQSYAEGAAALKEAGMEAATQAYLDAQAGIGTPEEIIEKYRHRMDVMGPCHAAGAFFYGGMDKPTASRSTELFAKEVMPELRKLFDEAVAKQQATASVA
jgi:alkanesulfonate monooxygenase SsuD/methylene tetrahydromethanopterin reductase-like flavin-dependent oxidoreductase (luciferase family)